MTRFTALYPQFVGFDHLFNELERLVEGTAPQRNTSFPPHNIIKIDDSKYVVEMAVAGFSQDEIDVEFQDGTLVVKGDKKDQTEVENTNKHYKLLLILFHKENKILSLIFKLTGTNI
jgi:molecular chaperone IbpA